MTTPDVSVVCPLFNEEESVGPLIDAVSRALADVIGWELVLVDDGSSDRTVAVVKSHTADPRVRLVRLARNYGQSTATQAGFDASRGRMVVTMDGDLQNDPRDIPNLVSKLGEGFDLVVGYRETRRDRLITRKLPSRVANVLIRWLTGVPIIDNGCSLKAYHRETLVGMRLYSDMHRFIPALAVGATGAQIAQIPVRHHGRRFGTSKYGLSRVWKVLADLMTVTMLRWFGQRPLLLFAYGGIAAFAVATVFFAAQLAALARGPGGVVYSGAAVLFMGLALYFFMVGLIAQVATHEWALHASATAGPRGRR
ncbi:MAG: glycosyltransferase family 2 protein [Gemmatimonadota bacterium]|nr:glycosyltransferase family 2 protein [Gemmatimonadota bacterium]